MITYTPYDGSSTPFTIGLTQLDLQDWIEPDAELAKHLAEKRRLLAGHCEAIFRTEPDTLDAQQEVLRLLADYLPERHADLYRREGDTVHISGGQAISLGEGDLPPLMRAGLLVQDDLVIMRRGEDGWRIASAFVAFPSSWSLEEKFGRVMDDVHADVPGFEGGSRNAELINRMFDRLQPDRSVKRLNWSINWNDALFSPKPKSDRVVPDIPAAESFVRVERQTLRKLPQTGDILFTIRIYVDPIAALAREPNGAWLMRNLASQLEALTPEEAAYKGITHRRAEFMELLMKRAENLAHPQPLP